MNNKIFINLDKEKTIPKLTPFQGLVDIQKNGRLIVKNSVLENIDTMREDELTYILRTLKSYISPVVTSQYILSIAQMNILYQLAPEFKVRFKTEKPGGSLIIPISSKEFFEGERIFSKILAQMKPEWTELQKHKYLYNRIAQMLSYDVNTLEHNQYSNVHEKYARNIFTAILKNWGLCASFAAINDYLCYRAGLESQVLSEEEHDYLLIETLEYGDLLTDVTFDSAILKFGMKSRNFGISRKKFVDNGHKLDETEASDYDIGEVSEEIIEQLDRQTGYLTDFGGEYTDKYISDIGNNLEGINNFEKAENLFERIRKIKYVGRPSTYDFETIIKFILLQSKDREFANKIVVYTFASDNTPKLPRQIAVEINESDNSKRIKYYEVEDGVGIKEADKREKTEHIQKI